MMRASEGLRSMTLKNMLGDHVCRYEGEGRKMPLKILPGPSSHELTTSTLKQTKSSENSKRLFAKSIKDHVKERLSLGAKILQAAGTEKVYKRIFGSKEGEQLLKAFHCCLFTTAGQISGLLFISNHKLAFCSDKSVVKFTSPTGELLRFRYKVVIPLTNIAKATKTENVNQTSQKYLHLVTMDDFEFWFMGFLNYKKMFKCLQQAVSRA